MIWKIPSKIKVYEALGTIADKRIELAEDKKSAKVFSSSRNKFYTVTYEESSNSIMANDNGSYWQSYLGYPSISFLMLIGKITYKKEIAEALKGIVWKDLNAKFKNDFEGSMNFVMQEVEKNGVSKEEIEKEVDKIYEQIINLNMNMLGPKIMPPSGY